MKYYTDMAFERFNCYFKADESFKLNNNIEKVVVEIDSKDKARYFGKPLGRYVCLNIYSNYDFKNYKTITNELSSELKSFLISEKSSSILIIGLGNENIVCDSLGVLACKKVISGNVGEKKVCSFCPSVEGITGIDSSILISNLIKQTKCDIVVIIDSFYAINLNRLGKSFQISNGGMKLNGNELTKKELGVPVIVIGCPFAIKMESVINSLLDNFCEYKRKYKINLECLRGGENVVTLLNVNNEIKKAANIISSAINMAIHNLEFDDVFTL